MTFSAQIDRVNKPASMPMELFRFMMNPSEERISCTFKVNQVGVELFQKGTTLSIGYNTLNHIVANIFTCHNLTKTDFETLFTISGPFTDINNGTQERRYEVVSLVEWIECIEWPKKMFVW